MGETKKPKKFIYQVNLKWAEAKKGLFFSSGKPTIEVATPPEFKGHSGIWTPEELFVASVNACIMTTFLYYADRGNFKFLSYESSAEGVLEKKEGGLIFSSIEIVPRVVVNSTDDIEKAKNLLQLSEKNCLISNSIKTKITLKPIIKV